MQLIASTDSPVVDKDLGNGAPAAGSLGHLLAGFVVAVDGVLLVSNAFLAKQSLRLDAVRTGLPTVKFNLSFCCYRLGADEEISQEIEHLADILLASGQLFFGAFNLRDVERRRYDRDGQTTGVSGYGHDESVADREYG